MSIQIQKVTDKSFRKYGRILTGEYDVAELMDAMEKTECPDDAVIYIPSDKEIEKLPVMKAFTNSLYGGLPIQIGYCNGNNHKLNAVEYHRNSEINIAVTDMILLLGWLPDVTDEFTYDTAKIEAFKVPAGTVVEMYETTLHYAPCNAADGGFKCVVILPKGTNTPIDFTLAADGEDKLMTAKNKWLIAHEEAAIKGAFNGLRGENISL